ncbi:MAG: hypothetical protein KTR24_08345 [Saprospiraceae bacterium]|nr:hypothetical protein [Saprospiraceae bacterium]
MRRRLFLEIGVTLSGGTLLAPFIPKKDPNLQFFTLTQSKDGHWWFLSPRGQLFFSLGVNHIDPASLHYPENVNIWKQKYGGSMTRWLQESVAVNLRDWGFNSVGWVQEVTVRQWRHSRSFTHEEFQALGMPYCKMLPFTESHQWEQHTQHFDFESEEWREWCDYVARANCAELSEDPNLIGYFYSDCPTWIHTRPQNDWRGPIFDPDRLQNDKGKRELKRYATSYYRTIHEAIRRYDSNHLLLGDRYEANAPISEVVLEAAVPYVDVFSFQDFRDPVVNLDYWHKRLGKPVLLADAAQIKWQTKPGEFTRNNGKWYAETLNALFQNPGCVGFHLCGAYQRNKARRYGLLDEYERPDAENISQIREANMRIKQLMTNRYSH